MKYFSIFDKNIATIFQLQWKTGNILTCFCNILCYVGSHTWISRNLFADSIRQSIFFALSRARVVSCILLVDRSGIVTWWLFRGFSCLHGTHYIPFPINLPTSCRAVNSMECQWEHSSNHPQLFRTATLGEYLSNVRILFVRIITIP